MRTQITRERTSMPYHLNQDGGFIIDDYQAEKTFANFFPGVAGLYGIPMWAFYVNRGQAISSFGIESKDKAILEFQPANKAYRTTSLQGFRTFLKIGQKFYEPFANPQVSPYKIRQRMTITSHDLTIEETNATLGLRVRVNYFTLPEEPFAALVRQVHIENLSRRKLSVACVDGLPVINPYGLKDWLSKNLSRTVEAWATVQQVDRKTPFYQLKVEVADTPQVTHIPEGHFYLAFDENGRLLDPIVEAACVFGNATDFLVPEIFKNVKHFKIPTKQQTANRMPSAMVHALLSIPPGKAKSLTALSGFAHDLPELDRLTKAVTNAHYVTGKAYRNQAIIEEIKGHCFTAGGHRAFDQYCGQTFLDNVLRGGLPVSVKTAEGPVPLNVYSRKHGDLERDYNFFVLAPTFLSQGNGNFRDVNQNRRNDVWFNQDVADSAIINFLNLGQADGYNPLIVKGLTFAVDNEAAIDAICKDFVPQGNLPKLKRLLKKGFSPGELLKFVLRECPIKGRPEGFLSSVLSVSHKHEQAEFGEGYWSDHWTYNLDLIESYLRLYPEQVRTLLLEKKVFHFYLSDAYVLPRAKRYILTDRGVRQYHSLAENDAQVKATAKGHRLRMHGGQGEVYHTVLLVKLLCVLANKAASLDPSGVGIEMEANKPDWYDALNGLPGLLGSSINETFELQRLARFVQSMLAEARSEQGAGVGMFVELADFIQGLAQLLSAALSGFDYWEKSNDLKEHYRQSIRLGIDGKERAVSFADIDTFLTGIIRMTERGAKSVHDAKGLFPSYFYHEVTKHEELDHSHPRHVRALAFKRHDLPHFLEGFVHALRVSDRSVALALHQAVDKSDLYDRKLKMYKVNAPLSGESEEIGRTRIFPPGWLENESVWLHMEYKYLLELLRRDLPEQFFAGARQCLIPFQDPARYGRSVLENSSFIVSSAHEDKNLHGQGFVARLSGSTAEFVHMWLLMCAGLKPFGLNEQGQLTLTFKPILPSWLFSKKAEGGFPANTFAFKFLNSALVVYHNPKQRNTFGSNAVAVLKMVLTYPKRKDTLEISGGTLSGDLALDVRGQKINRIDVFLG